MTLSENVLKHRKVHALTRKNNVLLFMENYTTEFGNV